MMQTLPSHPPLSCKNERKLCNQVSGVLLTYLLLMNLTVIAAMLVEAGLRLIHLGTLGYGLNAALHRVMQPDYLTQLLQSGTGYLVSVRHPLFVPQEDREVTVYARIESILPVMLEPVI